MLPRCGRWPLSITKHMAMLRLARRHNACVTLFMECAETSCLIPGDVDDARYAHFGRGWTCGKLGRKGMKAALADAKSLRPSVAPTHSGGACGSQAE